MEFEIKKCRVLVIKRGKVDKAKSRSLNLSNGKLLKAIDEEGYRYIGIIEYDKGKKRKWKRNLLKNIKGRQG